MKDRNDSVTLPADTVPMMSSTAARFTPRSLTAARVAWLVWSCAIVALIGMAGLSALAGAPFLVRLPTAVAFTLAFASVGALIVARQPGNAVGRVCLGIGTMFALTLLVVSYADYTVLVRDESLPGTRLAVWLSGWMWFASLIPVGVVLLLFPNGQPPSRRWWSVAWLIGAGAGLMIVGSAVYPGIMVYEGHAVTENPTGIPLDRSIFDAVIAGGSLMVAGGLVGAIISLIVRFRRSRGIERQQMKWLAAVAVLVILAPVWVVLSEEIPALADVPVLASLRYAVMTAALSAVPVAIGVAILRHNLYDIDRIINRALVYAILTATLLTLYLGIVIGLGQAVRAVTGESSQLVVAASTLAVAALFRPLRRRFQALVDRRFYRRKYDASRTLDAFSTRLRDEIDLHTLTTELAAIVHTTTQPAHISLWLRTAPAVAPEERK